jgi:hypothetical protein
MKTRYTQRPLREYDSGLPACVRWKTARRIQAELHLMRMAYAKRSGKNTTPRHRDPIALICCLLIGFAGAIIAASYLIQP